MGIMILPGLKTGDSTLMWSDENNDKIREVIETKMKAGWSFFIVKPESIPGAVSGAVGWVRQNNKPIKKISELKEDMRAVSLDDADFSRLIVEGFAGLGDRGPVQLETTGRAKDAGEVASGTTVAVKPKAGG